VQVFAGVGISLLTSQARVTAAGRFSCCTAMNNLDTGVHNKQTPRLGRAGQGRADPQTYWHSRLIERRDDIERLLTSDEKFMIFVGAERHCFVVAGVPVT